MSEIGGKGEKYLGANSDGPRCLEDNLLTELIPREGGGGQVPWYRRAECEHDDKSPK